MYHILHSYWIRETFQSKMSAQDVNGAAALGFCPVQTEDRCVHTPAVEDIGFVEEVDRDTGEVVGEAAATAPAEAPAAAAPAAAALPPPIHNAAGGGERVLVRNYKMDVDRGMLALANKHPFRLLFATPLLVVETVSLVLCTVSGLLAHVILHSGDDDSHDTDNRQQARPAQVQDAAAAASSDGVYWLEQKKHV